MQVELCVGFCLPPSDRSEKSGDILLGSICQPHIQTLQIIESVFCKVPNCLNWCQDLWPSTLHFGMLGCRQSAEQPGSRHSWNTPRYITYSTTQWLDVVISFWAVGSKKNPTRYRILICLPSKKLGFTHHPITSITVTTKMITFFFGPEIPTTTFICPGMLWLEVPLPEKLYGKSFFY